ncbi:BTAD domain-containing putative transcriptional regulator [Citricoccus nitrophenolicus]|uniref:BTAD domain-containing putative transcriptional regulator n=1 Tax=Citricoccus nitrophenolicus TaxID=863575 RepID=UPI0031E70DFC
MSRTRGRSAGLIIRSKLAVPPLAERLVMRPRLNQLFSQLINQNRVVWVAATAGSGKTTAIVQAAATWGGPIAWLTLDGTDAAPGRFLIYLEAAIAAHVPDAAGLASSALTARIPHPEVAGLLAESVGDEDLLLVLDGLENLVGAYEALDVVGAVVRYAPVGLKVVLLTRVDLPIDLSAQAGVDRVATIGEEDLAFTPEEAAGALVEAGITDIDASSAVEATGGWVTGVLFEAWHSRLHISGTGGEADPLHGYLASQILAKLAPEEREFLVVTSLLDEVTPSRAAALGQSNAGDLLVRLRSHHLPVSWISGTYRMRCHPRFREYLVTCLERRGKAEVQATRRAYGDFLVTEGHLEEAVEQFLAAEELDRAVDAAEVVIGDVLDRLDFVVAERWLGYLAPPGSSGSRRLGPATLMLSIAREDYRKGVAIADDLQANGVRDDLARLSPRGGAIMAWCYWHLDRLDDMRAVIDLAPNSPEIDAVRYLLSLATRREATGAYPAPTLSGGPLDALVMRVHYAHGRLSEVSKMPDSPWAAAVSAPWRVGALRATGRLTEALELYRSADAGHWAPAWMHGIVGPELMIDLEDTEEAQRVLAKGQGLVRASGSVVFEWLNRLIEAKLELRLNHDPVAALNLLEQVENAGGRHYDFISEALDTWKGLALLLSRSDNDDAVVMLRRAVNSMTDANRILDLPAAAIYLAEAEWRQGDLTESDAAADQAMVAARLQESNHQILLALADFQAVLTRRLDSEEFTDSPWHELGQALMARGVGAGWNQHPVILLSEFGRIAISVAGQEVKPRIAKSLNLLAYLAAVPSHHASREDLLSALFDGQSDESARAYLRQAAHRLREALPAGIGPIFTGNTLSFTTPVILDSESTRFEALIAKAARLRGQGRLEALLKALAIVDSGEYLPGMDSSWATQRREQLEEQAAQARLQAAQMAFTTQQYRQAEQLAEQVVAQDPYKESAWRILMRIASATGNEDGVVASYRRCKAALQELGITPSDSTQQMFQRLRR